MAPRFGDGYTILDGRRICRGVRSNRVNYKEDRALAQFSDAYVRYLATTPAFVPRLLLEQTRGALKETLLQRLIAELDIAAASLSCSSC